MIYTKLADFADDYHMAELKSFDNLFLEKEQMNELLDILGPNQIKPASGQLKIHLGAFGVVKINETGSYPRFYNSTTKVIYDLSELLKGKKRELFSDEEEVPAE